MTYSILNSPLLWTRSMHQLAECRSTCLHMWTTLSESLPTIKLGPAIQASTHPPFAPPRMIVRTTTRRIWGPLAISQTLFTLNGLWVIFPGIDFIIHDLAVYWFSSLSCCFMKLSNFCKADHERSHYRQVWLYRKLLLLQVSWL